MNPEKVSSEVRTPTDDDCHNPWNVSEDVFCAQVDSDHPAFQDDVLEQLNVDPVQESLVGRRLFF